MILGNISVSILDNQATVVGSQELKGAEVHENSSQLNDIVYTQENDI